MAFLLKRKEDLTSTVYKIFTYKKPETWRKVLPHGQMYYFGAAI